MSGFDWNRLGARPKNAGAVKRGGRGRQARDLSRAYAQECVAAAAAAAAPTPAPPPATSTPPASGTTPPASGTPQPASGTLPPAYGTNQPSSASGKKKKKCLPALSSP